jgi:anti-sigma B factor antagonist
MALLESVDPGYEGVSISVGDRPNVIAVVGELDASNKMLLAQAISDARSNGWLALEVDLAGVTFLDSAALGVLIATYKTDPVGGIRVINPSPAARRLLELTGLADRFLRPE